MKVIDIRKVIESLSAERSAWRRGVRSYAMDLLEDIPDYQDLTPENCRGTLLNGAGSWQEWSYGGCGLVYDVDIAERLCTPSELRKRRGGELEPSSHESWLDVEGMEDRDIISLLQERTIVIPLKSGGIVIQNY